MAVDAEKLAETRARLSKKATFEAAVADLRAWIEEDASFATSTEASKLAARCATLLRTRYAGSAVGFWKISLGLFEVQSRRQNGLTVLHAYRKRSCKRSCSGS